MRRCLHYMKCSCSKNVFIFEDIVTLALAIALYSYVKLKHLFNRCHAKQIRQQIELAGFRNNIATLRKFTRDTRVLALMSQMSCKKASIYLQFSTLEFTVDENDDNDDDGFLSHKHFQVCRADAPSVERCYCWGCLIFSLSLFFCLYSLI